ncbi:MAG: hypothetical protein ACT4O9_07160 [Blastocatellia bacterium]
MMKLAYRVFIVTLTLCFLSFAAIAQTDPNKRSEKDDRNTAPTVGTGGPMGGPTGLFTVYDGSTLRKGEYTFSAAYSNFDRDPGNADITEVPLSFQIGLTNNFELFFNIDGYRAVKVNSPRNLSGFYLPNSRLNIGGIIRSAPAIILAPSGPGAGPLENRAVFRPTGSAPFVQFPYIGGAAGNFGTTAAVAGPLFGFGAGGPTLGPPTPGGNGADNFPGIGSVFGSILPGLVLTTSTITTAGQSIELPGIFTLAPSYLPDAPFINRTFGESAFSTWTVGGKWRWTGNDNPVGAGVIVAYRGYLDNADDFTGFNQLQRGASPGGNRGDILTTLFVDARLRPWANLSANVGYHYNASVKGDFPGGQFTLLDRPDELLTSVGVDLPVNKWFQPIFEFRSTRYMGGRTPNAFENHPIDGLAGVRIFPARWFGFGFAYRLHVNQQDRDSFDEDETFTSFATIPCPVGQTGCVPQVVSSSFRGAPNGFNTSSDPHGYIVQTWIGRRNPRQGDIINPPANVTALTVSDDRITLPCGPGTVSRSGAACNDSTSVNVTTTAVDPDNDVLVYNYTVSGGRIVGQGANVSWDLSGAAPGTYTITAAVDDGCGICGKTETKTVTIEGCIDCIPRCACPSLSVTGPAGITNPGDAMTFTANVSGGADLTYNWTVSGGTIESGQGTRSILVRTTVADAGSNITATVDLGGLDPACGCPTTASERGPVDPRPTAPLVDEFGKLANDVIRGRLDTFFAELANNPNNQGYIINYGTDRDVTAREKLINNHIKFRNFDASRITMVRGGDTGAGVNTKLYRVPPGADNPNP